VFGAADRIVVPSPNWRDVHAARADERKLVVLPNAVQPDAYEPTYDADPPRIVYVSSLVDRKGILEFVEAIDQLCSGSDREFRVDIAGDGQHAERVERLADRREEARYLGYVSEARKQELLGDGSIYVLPTYAECLPIAMLEGMAGGNAVVATPVGGIPDVIDDRNGVLVPPGDQTALAEALEGLLASPAEIEQMGRRNRTLAREAFDWNGATDRLCRLYADVVDDPEVEVR
jgi:glycosyltransferase involved in cell wall biosynthesis